MATGALPLNVIGGFLGAGKTTLINHWLRTAQGERIAVLVNDFGAINIDSALIASRSGDVIALCNGCVCCQIGDDLTQALIRVLDASPPFDRVVVEASGVSDPARIAQLGRGNPELQLDAVIVVVDAAAVRAQHRDAQLADTIERQLRAADFVLVNKVDQVDPAHRSALRHWLTSLAGPVPLFETHHAKLPSTLLTGLQWPHSNAGSRLQRPGTAAALPTAPAHGRVFESWSRQSTPVLAEQELRAWLACPPSGLLRLKGIVQTARTDADPVWTELQFAGRNHACRKHAAQRSSGAVVAIGLRGRLPVAALNAIFGQPD